MFSNMFNKFPWHPRSRRQGFKKSVCHMSPHPCFLFSGISEFKCNLKNLLSTDPLIRSVSSIIRSLSSQQFSQNPDLKRLILDTDGTVLVEASPRDCIWGIGLGADNPKAQRKATWRGKNLLGYALTEVREQLKQE